MLAEREKATGAPVLCVLYNLAIGSPCADTALAQSPVPPLTHSLSTSHMCLSSASHLPHAFWLPVHGHGHVSTFTCTFYPSPHPQNLRTLHQHAHSLRLHVAGLGGCMDNYTWPQNVPVPVSLLARALQNSRNPMAVISWVSLIALEMRRKRWVYAPNVSYDICPFREAVQSCLQSPLCRQPSLPTPVFPTRARDIVGSCALGPSPSLLCERGERGSSQNPLC